MVEKKGSEIEVGDNIVNAGVGYMIRPVSNGVFKLYLRGTQPIFLGKDQTTKVIT